MNAPVTRRALLGATAAVGAVGLPALAAAEAGIPASDLDADLFALLNRWHEAQATWEATAEPYDAAQARAHAAYPPRPDTLRSGFRDQCFSLGAAASGREPKPSGRIGMFFTTEDVEQLRNSSPVTQWAMVGDDVQPTPREPDPKGEARRQEIIAAHDGWERARTAAEDATGYTAEVEVTRAAAAAVNAAEDAVALCQPRTVAGLVRKAAWVADLLSRDAAAEDLAETFVRQVAAFGEVAL